ncbi:polysaccharide pyruvyl transferase family protein [Colwellia sp. MB3u-70]|uniref:polysaccharide pyruvyl transferase family protein n=1 Tax=unclassified Colwellia TaxID=196834 RepID=UPI0015F699C2|nr:MULTISPECIES: polysaccharide pyruvyl transferase family protein [unclassified Colwellia]MBA6291505.1 polysaccharide pyruvyl transferase family protein [Colwellia sp. MB3u-8]MBA6305647.1 polysaccharide pyruvyl transferase family protein [Colwellia sp. MB3u-70]
MSLSNTTKPYYVILTGSKNNAGDYLIKFRAKQLFAIERSDRDIIDINGWERFDNETLKLVNNSEALILMGGPALQKEMYPMVYPLLDDLNKIKTKIVLMGVGWKSLSGNWNNTYDYQLSSKTIELLQRIKVDGLISSVRDLHTKNVLDNYSFKNNLMTGCPATYSLEHFNVSIAKSKLNVIGFSLGVSFINSKEMLEQMQSAILKFKNKSKSLDAKFIVCFHHSTKKEFLDTHGSSANHLDSHLKFISWLESHQIEWSDISGSAENLIEFYNQCDFHVGYRVHAHIYMSSISKPSILIAEDGRGKALRRTFGAAVVDGFYKVKDDFISKLLRKLKVKSGYIGTSKASSELFEYFESEINNNLITQNKARQCINLNYQVMQKFLKQLP